MVLKGLDVRGRGEDEDRLIVLDVAEADQPHLAIDTLLADLVGEVNAVLL
jgi:hypothetical protein